MNGQSRSGFPIFKTRRIYFPTALWKRQILFQRVFFIIRTFANYKKGLFPWSFWKWRAYAGSGAYREREEAAGVRGVFSGTSCKTLDIRIQYFMYYCADRKRGRMKGNLSIRETSCKWGISERRVNQYVAQGRNTYMKKWIILKGGWHNVVSDGRSHSGQAQDICAYLSTDYWYNRRWQDNYLPFWRFFVFLRGGISAWLNRIEKQAFL